MWRRMAGLALVSLAAGGGVPGASVRREAVVAALVTHRVAVEINGQRQLPGEAFVRTARAAGAKFTFGHCAVGTPAADDCFGIRERVGLSWRDMYVPGHEPARGARPRPESGVAR
jgi:hypothetical protein